MTQMELRLPTDGAFRHAFRWLRRQPNVTGVGWGAPRAGGTVGVRVHVRSSAPDGLRSILGALPDALSPYPIHVSAPTDARTHTLDHVDRVSANQGPSTPTVVVPTKKGAVCLVSGHGALPIRNGRLRRHFDAKTPSAQVVTLLDAADKRRFRMRVLAGDCGAGAVDWAYGVVDDVGDAGVDSVHLVVGARPPLLVRRTPLVVNEQVLHFSNLRGTVLRGRVNAILSNVAVGLPDHTAATFSNVATVRWGEQAFSIAGDSGSLVGDREKLAVGSILGGSVEDRESYVVQFAELERESWSRTRFGRFFQG